MGLGEMAWVNLSARLGNKFKSKWFNNLGFSMLSSQMGGPELEEF